MINSQFYKRFFYYTLCIIPGLGFWIHRIRFTHFNVDEFQHTYLAWATTHFDMIQYRDFWDNHGILYTLFNSAIVGIFKPEVGVPAIMLERYANLALLIIGFYILFEVFYELSSKLHYASLGVLCFSYGLISQKGIEVRPDNLQWIFLYSALLVLFKALKRRNNKLAFIAGLFITLMLMTNLKSISALMGIGFGLIVALAYERSKSLMSLILWLGAGILSGLVVFALGFLSWGILDDYINWNVIFNFQFTHDNLGHASLKYLHEFYYTNYFAWSLLCLCGGFFFSLKSFEEIKNRNYLGLILSCLILNCFVTRSIYLFWTQFDLLYLPIVCFSVSYMFFWILDLKLNRYLLFAIWVLGLLICLQLSFCSYAKLLNDWRIVDHYFRQFDSRTKKIYSYLGSSGYLDYYGIDSCPGFGFNRNSNFLIHKYRQSIYSMEKIEQKEIFGRTYINELNNKKVKLIIATRKGILSNHHYSTVKYIFDNYKYVNCLWIRTTPFTAALTGSTKPR